jgi:hypothetical protein
MEIYRDNYCSGPIVSAMTLAVYLTLPTWEDTEEGMIIKYILFVT